MTKRLAVLIVLAACVLLYRGADFLQSLAGVPSAASFGKVDLRGGRMIVTVVPPVDLDGRPSFGAAMGLKVDDAVVAFERADGTRIPVTGLNSVGDAMRTLPRQGGGAMIVLRRDGNVEREARLPFLAGSRSGPITIARVWR